MEEQGRDDERRVAGAGRKAARVGRRAAALSGRAAENALHAARRVSHAQGAGETGLYRLIELHAFNAGGDAALAISLAGTLFFQVPSGEARSQIALFLGVTMLPFAVLAPLLGPFLDRFRRGRRWAIGATMAVRAFSCWAMASAVHNDSPWLFPAALACLIASKAYGVTRASAVPRVLPRELSLVKANSRISLAGIAGAVISAPLATGIAHFSAGWALRYATLVYVGGTILAVLLPSRVDSSEGEVQVEMRQMADTPTRARHVVIRPTVITALRCNSGLRILSGFLTMYMAFLLREQPIHGWEQHKGILIALVIGAAGAGSGLGTLLGNLLRDRKPENLVLVTLAADAAAAICAALLFGLITALVLGLVAGLSQQLGKLSLDALIQREVAEDVRTSVFGRSETLLQLSWVIGGFLGVFMPLIAPLGLSIVAGVLVLWLLLVLRGRTVMQRRHAQRPGRARPA